MIGTTIANFRIDEKLGEGGMGVVYKATDLNLDRTVAIKVLAADLSRDPGLLERFRAEAKAQAHLNHTNIASLYTLLTVDGQTSIVMEYLEGETLDQMLRRRGLIPSEEAVPLFRQALLGIGFAHRMGIIHRDIKPANIMVNKYGVVKVMDFGIAKVLGGQRLTRTGTQVGTVAYMSPEQIRNKPVDIRSDIYSLGITLYELLTAHLPFESDSEFQVMSDHVNTPPPAPTTHYPYVPHGIEQCVMKALVKDPSGRFQTVEEFGAALEHPEGIDQWLATRAPLQPPPVLHTGGTPPPVSVVSTPPPLSSTPPPVPPPSPFWSKKNRPFIVGGAALLVLACAIGGYELLKARPPIPTTSTSSGGGSAVLLSDTRSHITNSQSPTGARSTNPLLSDTNPPADTAALPKELTSSSPAIDASAQALQNAQRALNGGRLFRPRASSAFYWAKQAEQSGNPDAARLEQTILETAVRQVQRYRDAKNFGAASILVDEMLESYPANGDVRQLSAGIQNDQRAYQQQQLEAQQAAQQAAARQQEAIQAQQAQQAEAKRQQQIEAERAEQLRQQARAAAAISSAAATTRAGPGRQLHSGASPRRIQQLQRSVQ